MSRFYAVVEYDGANYNGFQIQNNGITIQEVLEKSLSTLLGEPIKVVASGRTDSEVSARGQVIHFDSNTTIPAEKVPFAIERLLPKDISITSCKVVSSDFHARYSAKRKTYSYTVYFSKVNRPLYDKAYRFPYDIDRELLKEACSKLIGEHDFRAFMATGSSIKGTIRTIYDIRIKEGKDMLKIYIEGNGFLYNMVRIIVGTTLDIARGRLPLDTIDNMLKNGDRAIGGHTAPAHALCLECVKYND